jgi:hypothetical protein
MGKALEDIGRGNYFFKMTNFPGNKKKNWSRGLHQIKKILKIKGNNYQSQETAHRIKETFGRYSKDEGLKPRVYK